MQVGYKWFIKDLDVWQLDKLDKIEEFYFIFYRYYFLSINFIVVVIVMGLKKVYESKNSMLNFSMQMGIVFDFGVQMVVCLRYLIFFIFRCWEDECIKLKLWLFWVLNCVFGKRFWIGGIFKILNDMCQFVGLIFLFCFLEFMQNGEFLEKGYIYVVIIFLGVMVGVICEG